MILIKNGRVVDPYTKRNEILDIIVEDEKIKSLGKFSEDDNYDEIIDAGGMIAAPGLIDVHVHFRTPGFSHKEDFATGAASAARGGFTTVVCMANTRPVIDSEDIYKEVQKQIEKLPINVVQAAAITKGLKGKEIVDMKALKGEGVLGFTDDGLPLMDEKVLFEAMKMAKELNVPLSFHEENPAFVNSPGVNQGKISEQLGLGGASSLAEEVMVARDCMIALKTGAKVNIQHISSGVTVDIIRMSKAQGADVWAEVTPHHFSLNEEAVLKYGTNAKMNPPLRTEEDRMKLIEGLKDNTIELIATDHAPHTEEEKNVSFGKAPSGIIGLETSLALGVTNLVKTGYLTMMELIAKMTLNPAKLYNMPYGTLKEGARADIVLFNEDELWKVEDFSSKSKNSPFIGHELYGKVKYTICRGKVVYRD
ncbi:MULTISPECIES: dihydroorotase [Clostridium]|uniref:Dihydroorotase n=1 Tax=Clostridium cadaveris TaxID=1529 RepID=A0A1I2LWA4_9CLOT|nr:dihydroorotase [Clostridium cadaveris]MDM8310970.1 dihydroorotase [Clostridium cadaveris]MDU4952075.1 dihydroorotase [Clostridium sp.]SFF81261.1 dihydroorotase [Clostridium cadaveris]